MRPVLLLLVIVGLAGAARANAQPAARTVMSQKARTEFDRGATLYQDGQYAEAIAAFERGQRIDPHPDFLYALAQAYRKQGDCNRAIALYQAFLSTRPPSTEAARARANLERCPLPQVPGAAAAQATAPLSGPLQPTPALVPVQAPADDRYAPWYSDVLGDALLGAGLIAAGVGTTYLVLGTQKMNDATRGAKLGEVERQFSEGAHDRKLGGWCMAGGGALALAALVRYALRSAPRSTPDRADRAIRVVPRAGAVLVSWEARF